MGDPGGYQCTGASRYPAPATQAYKAAAFCHHLPDVFKCLMRLDFFLHKSTL
jgi:hypothetical protein